MGYTGRISKGSELSTLELDNNFLCHYPLGSIYVNALRDESPGELIGYGKWSKYAEGYVLVSADSPSIHSLGNSPDHVPRLYDSPDYYSPGFVGGESSVSITEWVKHTHEWQDDGAGRDGRYRMGGKGDFGTWSDGNNHFHYLNAPTLTTSAQSGVGLRHNNIQEYITVNIWKRIK